MPVRQMTQQEVREWLGKGIVLSGIKPSQEVAAAIDQIRARRTTAQLADQQLDFRCQRISRF